MGDLRPSASAIGVVSTVGMVVAVHERFPLHIFQWGWFSGQHSVFGALLVRSRSHPVEMNSCWVWRSHGYLGFFASFLPDVQPILRLPAWPLSIVLVIDLVGLGGVKDNSSSVHVSRIIGLSGFFLFFPPRRFDEESLEFDEEFLEIRRFPLPLYLDSLLMLAFQVFVVLPEVSVGSLHNFQQQRLIRI